MRYFDKIGKNEWLPPVGWDEILPANVVVLGDLHIFWSQAPANMLLDYDGGGLPILVTYAGSALELAIAIGDKQEEVRAHYVGLHGLTLADVTLRLSASSPAIAISADATTNAGIADGAIVAIAALLNKAAVDAFDVSVLAWV